MINCRLIHPQCHAACCGSAPIPVQTWKTKQHLIQDELDYAIDDEANYVHALTKLGNCPFKRPDYCCAIYPAPGSVDLRGPACSRFGDESHIFMTCPWADKNGRIRSRQKRRLLKRHIEQHIEKWIKSHS